jgi:L-ascorbate metabolism protein UlaG (beta-lactamase superfamily)
MRLTYIRWSMTIIETQGLTLITDPVFRLMGVHQAPKSYTFERMPRPDLVFISHTHADHFERATLKRLPPETPVWMPTSKVHKTRKLPLQSVRGVEKWESDRFQGIRLTAVPAQHTGGELGLVVEGDRTVYFAGDTSLDRDLFRSIGNTWKLDAVFLPIGNLRVLGVPIGHISPKKAPQALRLLGEPPVVVPIHYSGMSLPPLVTFGGTPRRLSEAIHKAELGALLGTTRPLEGVDLVGPKVRGTPLFG